MRPVLYVPAESSRSRAVAQKKLMRKEYAKAVRKEFCARFEKALPQFELSNDKESAGSGARLYELVVSDNLALYICLGMSRNFEEFIVEIAWSEQRRFPSSYLALEPEPKNGEIFRHLPRLWNKSNYSWWVVEPRDSLEEIKRRFREFDFERPPAELYLPRIPALVEDAVSKIIEYAVPYFEKVAAEHGYEINLREPSVQ